MTAEQPLISDEMRAGIGVEGPPRLLEVDRTSIRMFARAVGHTDPVFYDPEAARKRGYRDIIAPPGYLGTGVFRPTAAEAPPPRPPPPARASPGPRRRKRPRQRPAAAGAAPAA